MNNKTTMEYIAAVEAGNFPDDPRVPLDHKFEDERGVIKNLLHTPIMSVAMITSKKGTERANHFHRSNSHFAYVVSGKIEYFERDIEGKEESEELDYAARRGLLHKTNGSPQNAFPSRHSIPDLRSWAKRSRCI